MQAWTASVDFGPGVGVHAMKLCRLQKDGPVCTQLSNLGKVFKLIGLTLVEMRVDAQGLQAYFSESRPEVMAELMRRGFMCNSGFVASCATEVCVEVITVSVAHLLLGNWELGVPAHALNVLKALASPELPPRPPAPVKRCDKLGGAHRATCGMYIRAE